MDSRKRVFAFSPFLSATSIGQTLKTNLSRINPTSRTTEAPAPTMPNWDKKLDSERNDAFLSRATRSAPNADASIPAPAAKAAPTDQQRNGAGTG